MQNNFYQKLVKNIILLLVCFLSAYFITSIIVFPKNIKLIEGEKQYFDFRLPVEAVIEPQTVSVLKVNNEPVGDNLKINLYRNTELLAEESGSVNMTLNAFGINVKDVTLDFLPSNNIEVVPCGTSVGVEIKTQGILVLTTDYFTTTDNKNVSPSENILKSGDAILKVNDKELNSQYDIKNEVENSEGEVVLEVKRGDEIFTAKVMPEISKEDEKRKIGVHVRDKTKGIGTLTYYHPESRIFGALGHGIVDVDTKQIMDIKEGNIFKARIGNIIKGKKGVPGELSGKISDNEIIGVINKNNPLGIYGIIDEDDIEYFNREKKEIGMQSEVHEGPAKVLTNVEDDIVKEYDIYIDSVNKYTKDDSKGMVIKITDPELLDKTNGIVQGMSGSPIIQDEKVIGAVTHVFVQDPTKGYGIFIENMLKQEI